MFKLFPPECVIWVREYRQYRFRSVSLIEIPVFPGSPGIEKADNNSDPNESGLCEAANMGESKLEEQ